MDGIAATNLNWSNSSMKGISALASQPTRAVVVPTAVSNNQENNPARPNQITRPGENESTSQTNSSPNRTQVNQQTDGAALPSNKDTEQQQRQVEQVLAQLRSRDQEVRTHEQAHLSAAGQYATGGIKYSYQTGPDGQKYAIGGSVGIDTSPIAGDPEATAQKAMVVQRAALAPAQPSGQDMKVAAQASQMLMQAQAEIMAQRFEENKAESPTDEADAKPETGDAKIDDTQPQKINPARNEFELRLALQNQPSDLALTA